MILRKIYSFILIFLIFIISLFSFKKNNINHNNIDTLFDLCSNNYEINEEKEISNDINNFKNQKYNNYLFFEENNIYQEKVINHDLNNKINFRIQYQNSTLENWCEWISNSLNEVKSNINLINFNNDVDYINLINTKIYETIQSIYPAEKLFKYRMPRIAKETSGYPYFPEPSSEYINNTVNIFGTPLKNQNTHRISRYGAYGNKSIYSSHWYYADDIYDTIKYHSVDEIYNFFKIKESKNMMIENNSFKLKNYFYRLNPETFNTKTWGYSASGGSINGYINLYDNSNINFQEGQNRNRSFNDWFSNNYSDYELNNKSKTTKLGNLNIVNNISNIEIDFSKLIKISNKTSNFLNDENDVHKESPKISFTWNNELFNALKEYWLVNKYLINYIQQINLNNSLNIYKLNEILIKIYEYKMDHLDLKKLIENRSNIKLNELNDTKPYYKILKTNHWDFKYENNYEINNVEINKEILYKILNRSVIYEYIIPKIFSNDIWIEYEDENNNLKYSKIFDASKTIFQEINVPSKNNPLEIYNNLVKFKIKNIYMFNQTTNQVIYGSKYCKNNTLNLINIFKNSILKNKNIILENNNEISFYFLFNPLNFNQPSINIDSKSLTSLDILVSDVFNLEKDDIAKLTIDALKIPNEILNKFNDIFSGLIDKTASFNDPDINPNETNKYKEIYDYLLKKDLYWKAKNLFDQNQINEDDFLKAKYNLDNLGYFYLNLSISFPLNFYISINEYMKLLENNIIIEKGQTITGNYKYWLKYSASKKPLNINELGNYIDVNYLSSESQFENNLKEINEYLKKIKYLNNRLGKNILFNIDNIEIKHINDKYIKKIDALFKQYKIKKYKKFNDWYKFWNKVNINFDYIGLKNDLHNLLIQRNDEIFNYLVHYNNESLIKIINNLQLNNELLTKDYFNITNNIYDIKIIQQNILQIARYINSVNEYKISRKISVNFNLKKILNATQNKNNISKYWILNMNKLNEVFYVSKQVFISEFNKIIKSKTNLNFNLNIQHLFSYDFKNTSNDYLFNNLKLSYLYNIDFQTNLLDSLTWIFEKYFIDNIKDNSSIQQTLNSISGIINSKFLELNNIKIMSNNLLDEINNNFFENYLIRNYSIDNNEYFKNIAMELLTYKFTNIIKYELNYLLISFIIIFIILIIIFIILIIKKSKRNKLIK